MLLLTSRVHNVIQEYINDVLLLKQSAKQLFSKLEVSTNILKSTDMTLSICPCIINILPNRDKEGI